MSHAHSVRVALLAITLAPFSVSPVESQSLAAAASDSMAMPGMRGSMHHAPAATVKRTTKRRPAATHGAHEHAAPRHGMDTSHGSTMPGMDMSGMHEHAMHAMTGEYGPYPMTREASGTSWQPDAAVHAGIHAMKGPWMLMLHGMGDLVWDHQGGPRGDEKAFSSNMAMAMARRTLGAGTLGLRTMLSLEPATIGKEGYPLLLQSGETSNGVTPLIDRQHPHDLFMELAGSYAITRGLNSAFVYAGLPGEPALGPSAFMHRFSGESDPVAPITHHWLDSTHITFGVLTAGTVVDRIKVEASAFRGREPDQNRWNIDAPKLDSHSFRLSANPTAHWALQASYGRLKSPEQLEPDVDQDRTTASAIYDRSWSAGRWETTVGWGRTRNRPGHILDAWLAEGAIEIRDTHTFFARAEHVEKDELFVAPDPRAGEGFQVGEVTAGYRRDFSRRGHLRFGAGVAGTVALVPAAIRDAYSRNPGSVLLFAHAALR